MPISRYSEAELYEALSGRPAKRPLSLTEDELAALANRIQNDFVSTAARNSELYLRHLEFVKNWRCIADPDSRGPLGDLSANVRTPLTSTIVEQWKARLMEALLGDDNIVRFESLDASLYTGTLDEISAWFKWELINVVNIEEVLEDILYHVLVDGVALAIPFYERREAVLTSTKEYQWNPEQPLGEAIDVVLTQCFETERVDEISETSAGVFRVRLHDFDTPATVTFSIRGGDVVVADIVRPEIVFDGVRVKVPTFEDIVVPDVDTCLEKLPFFGIRQFMSLPAFIAETAAGGFFSDVPAELIEQISAAASDKTQVEIPRETSEALDQEMGTDSRIAGAYDQAQAQFIELYRWEGLVGHGGMDIPVVAWYCANVGKVIKVMRREEFNKDAKPTAVKFDFIKQPGRFYSIGVAELIYHSQVEEDGIHNFRLNSGFVATAPIFFYEKGAFGGQTPQIRPVGGVEVKSVNKVSFPSFSWSPVWSSNEELLVRRSAYDQAGIGDVGTPSFVSKRLSASEFRGVASNADLRTKIIVRRVVRQFRELLMRIFSLYQQYMPDGRVYQVSGINGEVQVKKLSRDRLAGKMVLRLTGGPELLDENVERELTLSAMQIMLNPYLVELGIVQPDTIYEIFTRVLRAFEIKGIPIHKPDVLPTSPPPEDEHNMMLRGLSVEPNIGEDFQEHLTKHIDLLSRPDINSLMPPSVIEELNRHIVATVQMYNTVQAIRRQEAEQAEKLAGQMAALGLTAGAFPRVDKQQRATEEEIVGGMNNDAKQNEA